MPIPHSPTIQARPLADRAALAALALVAAVALWTHGDYAGPDHALPGMLSGWLSWLPAPLDNPIMLGIAFGLATLALTWRAARHLAGPVGGLIALVVLAATPLHHGAMFVHPAAMAFAAACAGLLLGLLRAIAEWPRPSPATLAIVMLACAALAAFSPWPVQSAQALFRGEAVDLSDPPATYLPMLLGLKLPEIFLLLTLAGLVMAIAGAARAGEPFQRRAGLALAVLAVALPLALAMIVRPAIAGIETYLFVLPPLALAAGIAAGWAMARVSPDDRRLRAVAAAALMLGLLPPVTAMGRVHPYQHAAFNELSGGLRAMRPAYTIDAPGLSLREAAQILASDLGARGESPPAGRPWRVAICGPQAPARSALDTRFQLTTDPKGADFALMSGEFECAGLSAPQLAPVERDGVTLARVYDLRGRKIERLLMQVSPERRGCAPSCGCPCGTT